MPGDTITLTVAKPEDDITREVTITLAEHSDQAGQAYLGVQVGGFFRLKRSEDGSSIKQDTEMIVDLGRCLTSYPLSLSYLSKNSISRPNQRVMFVT